MIQGMLLSLQRVHHLNMIFAISLCIDAGVNCNCFDSFHCEGSREHKRLYCETLQHHPRQVPICHQFPNTEQYRTIQNTSVSIQVFQYLDSNQVSPINLRLRTEALRNHDVFSRHMDSILTQNSRSCFVCHCATQLNLEVMESTKTPLWTLKELTQRWKTVHKEHWLKQRRNLITLAGQGATLAPELTRFTRAQTVQRNFKLSHHRSPAQRHSNLYHVTNS